MEGITRDGLLAIHELVQGRDVGYAASSVLNNSSIDRIIERPFLSVYGVDKYDTIYKKAACYIENIVRLHPFSDGNKRTAAGVISEFMRINGRYFAVPVDVIGLLAGVAKSQCSEEEELDSLIGKTASWIEERTAASNAEFMEKVQKYVADPINRLKDLAGKPKGENEMIRVMNGWLGAEPGSLDIKVVYKTIKFGEDVADQIMRAAGAKGRQASTGRPE